MEDYDELGQKKFFHVKVLSHLTKNPAKIPYWYREMIWRNVTQGRLECCSDTFVLQHRVLPNEMVLLDYLIYNVHPFGIEKNLTEILPKKFTFNELLKMADEKSFSKFYIDHNTTHNFDDDERF